MLINVHQLPQEFLQPVNYRKTQVAEVAGILNHVYPSGLTTLAAPACVLFISNPYIITLYIQFFRLLMEHTWQFV
jgi:hypothetical protein